MVKAKEMNLSKKILVFGSNSFGGASYINYALANNYKIIGINRSKEGENCFLPYKKNKNKNKYTFHNFHLIKDLDSILKVSS